MSSDVLLVEKDVVIICITVGLAVTYALRYHTDRLYALLLAALTVCEFFFFIFWAILHVLLIN
jgi:uncharacterized membrane protein YccC